MLHFQGVISNFTVVKQRYTSLQKDLLDWIVAAHTQAEARQQVKNDRVQEELEKFREELQVRLWRAGCKPDAIFQRSHVIPDFLDQNWHEHHIYRLKESPSGVGLQQRQSVHREIVDGFFGELYGSIEEAPPNDIIHVSCTGYASPSAPQKMISKNNWEGRARATHLYHMGCYASLPAIRMGDAFLHQAEGKVDIVHTELCTLHMNPLAHSSSQLVSQSLFADGCIKYSMLPEKVAAGIGNPYLKILSMHEHIIPESSKAMEWLIGDWGFNFVLAKEIPVLIAKALNDYVEVLCRKACQNNISSFIKDAVFAVHPGGPKILDYVQKAFKTEDWQMQASRKVLKTCGNMSSATLPHIWNDVCLDPNIKEGTKILCMAFGPGLTIAGAILEKVG